MVGLYIQVGQKRATALDMDTDEFVELPGLPPVPGWELLSLSPDGTQMLYRGRYTVPDREDLFLYTLATGQPVRYDERSVGFVVRAALSPDGSTIATLTVEDDPSHPGVPDASLAIVSLIDVASAGQRRLWAAPGGWTVESVVAWSPDGHRIAVTYHDSQDDDFATVVLDTTGQQIGLFGVTQLIASGNGAWLDSDRVITGWHDQNGDWNTTILSVPDGNRDILAPCRHLPEGRIDHRLITRNTDRSRHAEFDLLTTDLRSADPQPFLSIDTHGAIDRFDTWMTPYEAAN